MDFCMLFIDLLRIGYLSFLDTHFQITRMKQMQCAVQKT